MGSIITNWMQNGQAAVSHLWARWRQDHQASSLVVNQSCSGRASMAITSQGGPVRPARIVVVRMDGRPGPLGKALEQMGYQVSTVQGLPGALASLEYGTPALIILNGQAIPDACLALRRLTSAPILALLPELTEPAVLDAFSAGADDCQLVTIGPDEAILRVRALLRRNQHSAGLSGGEVDNCLIKIP